MEGMGAMFGGIFGLVIIIFLLILAILWFILPFAIFGIKPKLDKILEELDKTNRLLANFASASKLASSSEEMGAKEK